jgi:hypothetical protein
MHGTTYVLAMQLLEWHNTCCGTVEAVQNAQGSFTHCWVVAGPLYSAGTAACAAATAEGSCGRSCALQARQSAQLGAPAHATQLPTNSLGQVRMQLWCRHRQQVGACALPHGCTSLCWWTGAHVRRNATDAIVCRSQIKKCAQTGAPMHTQCDVQINTHRYARTVWAVMTHHRALHMGAHRCQGRSRRTARHAVLRCMQAGKA